MQPHSWDNPNNNVDKPNDEQPLTPPPAPQFPQPFPESPSPAANTQPPSSATATPPPAPHAFVSSPGPESPSIGQPQFTPASESYNTSLGSTEHDPVVPTPVVQVLSPRGVEYVMLTISLFTAAIGLTAILLCLVNGQTGLMSLSLPVSLLIVGLPIFAALFLRLKKAELADPRLKLDQSKRRSTQATQIISFVVSLFTVVGLFVSIFATISGEGEGAGKAIASAFITLIIFGGILAYYWWDEHRN